MGSKKLVPKTLFMSKFTKILRLRRDLTRSLLDPVNPTVKEENQAKKAPRKQKLQPKCDGRFEKETAFMNCFS